MKKFICDHCGKEINDKDDYIDCEIDFEEYEFDCDLCAECKEELISNTIAAIEKFIGVD